MKRLVQMVCILVLLSACASAAMSVRMDDGALLLSEEGSIIVPFGTYADIVPVGNERFAAGKEGFWALMDASGNLLGEEMYSDLRPAGDLLLGERDGRWGVLAKNGDALGEFAYSMIVPVGNGSFWALRGNANDAESDELRILDPNGKERTASVSVRRMRSEASHGLLAVMTPENGLWGYCDAEGKLVIPALYSHAGNFVSGCAAVVIGGKYGVIDDCGATVVKAEYDFLEISPAGFILASGFTEGVQLMDLEGKILRSFEGEDLLVALVGDGFLISDGESLRMFDASGAETGNFPPDAALLEGLNGQMIVSDGAWGEECVYLNGTQQRWQHLYPLGMAGEDGVYACMRANAARYVNDLIGEIQISVDMESARYGVVNGAGELLLPCEYQSVEWIGNDRLLTHADGQWQVMDTAGRVYWSRGIRQTEAPIS